MGSGVWPLAMATRPARLAPGSFPEELLGSGVCHVKEGSVLEAGPPGATPGAGVVPLHAGGFGLGFKRLSSD
jgi:hypothetical protein